MAEPRYIPPHDQLERDLHDLGANLDWPPEPDLAASIRTRIATHAPGRSIITRIWGTSNRTRLAWSLAALAVVLSAVLMVAFESTRSTVADRLGLPGIAISTQPTATLDVGSTLHIGERSTIEDAMRSSDGNLVLPPEEILGPPDDIYLLDLGGGVQVTYIYAPTKERSEVGDSGISLLISQFDGATNDSFIRKQIGPGTTIELVEVNQQPAFWLSGSPHVFFYERPNGEIVEESIRLAANVLLWELDGTTLRIETNVERDVAVQIAEAMHRGR